MDRYLIRLGLGGVCHIDFFLSSLVSALGAVTKGKPVSLAISPAASLIDSMLFRL